MIAFIGGTGLYDLPDLKLRRERLTTSWGTVELRLGEHAGRRVAFLARHGEAHAVPPHAIDYRANLAALKAAGARAVVASTAVGTLSDAVPPGCLALLSDFLDLTSGRTRTYFDHEVVHLDYTEPYCPRLREQLQAAAARCGVTLAPRAVYAGMNGPRFETPAEIRALKLLGADVVGMTGVPEVVLARELELCYAGVAIATNHAAGLAAQPLTHSEVEEAMAARLADLRQVILALIESWEPADCACCHALDEYRDRRGEPSFAVPL